MSEIYDGVEEYKVPSAIHGGAIVHVLLRDEQTPDGLLPGNWKGTIALDMSVDGCMEVSYRRMDYRAAKEFGLRYLLKHVYDFE
jgi:DNA-binding transcriptional regulator PaaX